MKKYPSLPLELCPFSRRTLRGGVALSLPLYLTGWILRGWAPCSTRFIALSYLSRTLLELAPALLISCTAAALLCDLIRRHPPQH